MQNAFGGFEKCDSLKSIWGQNLQIVLNIHRSSWSLLNNDKNKLKWVSPGPHQPKLNNLATSMEGLLSCTLLSRVMVTIRCNVVTCLCGEGAQPLQSFRTH